MLFSGNSRYGKLFDRSGKSKYISEFCEKFRGVFAFVLHNLLFLMGLMQVKTAGYGAYFQNHAFCSLLLNRMQLRFRLMSSTL